MFRPAFGAVAMQDVDIVVAEFGERRGGLVGELAEAFDREHLGRDLRQHRCGIAGARADLERLLPALEHQGLRHEGDDIGLGNRLFAGDRERRILIGKLAKILRQEQFARHLAHGLKDEFVLHAAGGDVSLDHPCTQGSKCVPAGTSIFRRQHCHDDAPVLICPTSSLLKTVHLAASVT